MSIADVYDVREMARMIQVLRDDVDTLARTLDGTVRSTSGNNTSSTASSGDTILSSAQATTEDAPISDENDGIGSDPSSLSLNPSIIDSSLTSLLSSLSNSNPSHDSISSVSSQSTPCYSPGFFANVGRFLSADNNESDGISVLSLMTTSDEIGDVVVDGGKWWEHVDDWESFTAEANNYLKMLILEEMKESPSGVKKSAHDACNIGVVRESIPGYLRVWQWFQGLYESITNATRAGLNHEKIDSDRSKYMSSLIEKIVVIKKELDEMAPDPQSLPKDDPLLSHHESVNAWKRETMQRRERLERNYDNCREKLLACIIETEEEVFWKGPKNRDDNKKWSRIDNDGYVEVISENIPENHLVLQKKSAFIAGVIGAGLLVFLSSMLARRRG